MSYLTNLLSIWLYGLGCFCLGIAMGLRLFRSKIDAIIKDISKNKKVKK